MKKLMMAIALVAFFSVAAFATEATATLTVSSNIIAACTVASPTLAFGSYEPTGANATTAKDANTTFSIACTNLTNATIALGGGQNPDTLSTATAPLRRMKSGSSYLSYFLYADSAATTVWGGSTASQTISGTGLQENLTIYGRIPAASAQPTPPPSGDYSDLVTITVSY